METFPTQGDVAKKNCTHPAREIDMNKRRQTKGPYSGSLPMERMQTKWTSLKHQQNIAASVARAHTRTHTHSYRRKLGKMEGKQRPLLKSCKRAQTKLKARGISRIELDCISSTPVHHFWKPFPKWTVANNNASRAREENFNKRKQTNGPSSSAGPFQRKERKQKKT